MVGVRLLHDYGAFALYGVQDNAIGQLSPVQYRYLQQTAEQDTLLFDDATFNTQIDILVIPDALQFNEPQGEGLQLIQFVGPIKQEWLTEIEAEGSVPITYIAHNGYLVWTDDLGRQQLDTLSQEGAFLQYSIPFHPFFKLPAVLRERLEDVSAPSSEVVSVIVQLYDHPESATSKTIIQNLAVRQRGLWSSVLNYQDGTFDIHTEDLVTISQLPDVMAIHPAIEIELIDEIQGQILAGNLNAQNSGPSAPGYLTWLTAQGFSSNPTDYPIIDITDGGVGNGTIDSGDTTLHVLGNSNNPSRLAYISNCTAEANAGDVGGHGHINASIAAGYDNRSGFPFQDGNGYHYGVGITPFGRIASTKIVSGGAGDLTNCFDDFPYVTWQSYANGARISNNSWGCNDNSLGCLSTYHIVTQQYDAAVRDADGAEPGNQELTIVFGAGNDGTGSSIYTPANGKNVITVGGSESNNPAGTDGCGFGNSGADNAMDIASFSSRGPAPGGRVKPEIVAPATHIQGTTSSNFNGTTVCGGPGNLGLGLNPYFPAGQEIFTWSSGTSHATPAISGVVSLYTYWLENTFGLTSPSPAMLKAYLAAHTTYLTGADANDTLPSNAQGYGLPDMDMAFDDTPRRLVDQSVVLDNSGETWSFDATATDPSKPVHIVLTYTDQPGMVGTSPQVNDLNLQVEINGSTYWGNRFSGQWSITGGTPDSLNNYEAIYLPPGTSGPMTVTITGQNIAGDGVPQYGDSTDQDFALVCYNCMDAPDITLEVQPKVQIVCQSNAAMFDVTVEALGGFTGSIALSGTGQPPEATVSFAPSTIMTSGSSELSITNIGTSTPGDYKLTIQGTSAQGSRTATAWLRLEDTPPPATVTLLSPQNMATDIEALSPTFVWEGGSQAETYRLQVAMDSTFESLLYDTLVTGDQFTFAGRLKLETTYYWRVFAANGCGSSVSPVFSFTTVGRFPLLLVDDDNDELPFFNFPDVQPAFTDSLNQLGVAYEVWEYGIEGTDPTADTANMYKAMIWFTGDTPAGPDSSGEAALSSFLDGGGCLLISSQEYHSSWGLTSFMQTYLGVESVSDDVGYDAITGTGTVFGSVDTYALNDNSNWGAPAVLVPNETAEIAFVSAQGTVGITREHGSFQAAFLGFGLEDITTTGRTEILEQFFNWCEIAVSPPLSNDGLYLPLILK